MRLEVAYFLLDNVKVAASVAAKHMAGVHNCFKHYASPHGNKAARFTVGAILARLHGKEVQAAIVKDPHLRGKQQLSCGLPEQERFASEWLASHLDLVYERVGSISISQEMVRCHSADLHSSCVTKKHTSIAAACLHRGCSCISTASNKHNRMSSL